MIGLNKKQLEEKIDATFRYTTSVGLSLQNGCMVALPSPAMAVRYPRSARLSARVSSWRGSPPRLCQDMSTVSGCVLSHLSAQSTPG